MKILILAWLVVATNADFLHGPAGPGAVQFRSQGPDGYNFGYGHTHGAGGGASWQKESADAAGNVAGSYGLKDADGRTRVVNYVANQGGFHAHVQSNEPGVLPPVPGSQSGWQTGGYLTPVVGHVHPPGPSSGHDHWVPYKFSYDETSSGGSFHNEEGDASGAKRGSYGLPGRTVNYVADADGFRATVTSNEPGVDSARSPADVSFSGGREPGANVPVPTPGGDLPPFPALPGSDTPGNAGGSLPKGHGTQHALGTYDFEYGEAVGPFHKESGDAFGNKKGVYGLREHDGRTRTVDYVADGGGFRASVHSNEPGVDDTQSPADVTFNKGGPSSGPAPGILLPFPGAQGGGSPPWSAGGGAGGGTGGAVDTSFGTQDATGAYDFAYTGGPKGAFHKESGDSSGSKMGTYGLSGADGSVRIVDYTADGLGFRAHVQSNERGVDASKSPADVTFTNVGGIISNENHQHLTPPVQAPWSPPVLPGPWNTPPNPAQAVVATPQGPWAHAPVSGNPRSGSFFYESHVLGPEQSFVKVHHY